MRPDYDNDEGRGMLIIAWIFIATVQIGVGIAIGWVLAKHMLACFCP